jgi:hypothetical protein
VPTMRRDAQALTGSPDSHAAQHGNASGWQATLIRALYCFTHDALLFE